MCAQAYSKSYRGPGGAWDVGLSEYFINGTFVVIKKAGAVVNTKWRKGTEFMAVAEGCGFSPFVHAVSASPRKVTLVEETIGARFLPGKPEWSIGDWVPWLQPARR
ncbi:MAG: hypothetical protein JOZ19_02290 [Rubrobacter sp.]|nr:hypothetical protein [Rubrobacter sp.]